jgi:small subunit ribosomal protein S3
MEYMKELIFVKESILEQEIRDYLVKRLKKENFEDIEIYQLPTSTRIIIYTTQPGAIIGPGGENIEKLTNEIREKFKIDAQIDIKKLDKDIVAPQTIAKNIAQGIEKKKNYRRLAEYYLEKIMKNENVLGAEIILDGLISGSKTRKDKFSAGYMKKSGELAEKYVKKGRAVAYPPIGAIGVRVNIFLKPENQN